MNRFLKKEWDDTEIPQEVLLQTRNRAWQKLQHKRRRHPRLVPLAAAAALPAGLLLLWIGLQTGSQGPTVEQAASSPPDPGAQQSPAAQEQSPAAGTEPDALLSVQRTEAPSPPPVPATVERERPSVAPLTRPAPPRRREMERLVINFRLPQSGVRMIWIKQNNPTSPNGGSG